MYVDNTGRIEVVSADDPKVAETKTIIKEGDSTFTTPNVYGTVGAYKIGGGPIGKEQGVIGVFDHTNLAQLNLMARAAISATERHSLVED